MRTTLALLLLCLPALAGPNEDAAAALALAKARRTRSESSSPSHLVVPAIPSTPPAGAGTEIAQPRYASNPQGKTGAASQASVGYWGWHPTYGLTYWPPGMGSSNAAAGAAPRPFVPTPVITPGTPVRVVATSRPPAPVLGWSAGTTPTAPTYTPVLVAGPRGTTNDDCPT